jgi:pimeloyl-ACP methyl ester carboxylesterase
VSEYSTFLEIAGCKIHLLRGGSGTPLLFLHGASGGGAWLPFMEDLAQSYEIFAPEHPGFGLSDDPPWLDQVSDLAYFYLDLLDTLKLENVHLVGTSLGGWIAAEMAVRNTTRIASITLVCAVGILANGKPIDDAFRFSPEEHLARFCHGPENAAARRQQMALADPAIQARNRATVMRLGYRPRFHNPDLAKWLHRIDRPTKIIWGASDRIVPLAFGEAYQNLIRGAELAVIPNAGHAPFVEEPKYFLDEIQKFISNIR